MQFSGYDKKFRNKVIKSCLNEYKKMAKNHEEGTSTYDKRMDKEKQRKDEKDEERELVYRRWIFK